MSSNKRDLFINSYSSTYCIIASSCLIRFFFSIIWLACKIVIIVPMGKFHSCKYMLDWGICWQSFSVNLKYKSGYITNSFDRRASQGIPLLRSCELSNTEQENARESKEVLPGAAGAGGAQISFLSYQWVAVLLSDEVQSLPLGFQSANLYSCCFTKELTFFFIEHC